MECPVMTKNIYKVMPSFELIINVMTFDIEHLLLITM